MAQEFRFGGVVAFLLLGFVCCYRPPLTKFTVSGVWELAEKNLVSRRPHFLNQHWQNPYKRLLSLSPNGQFTVAHDDRDRATQGDYYPSDEDDRIEGVWDIVGKRLVMAYQEGPKKDTVVYVSDIEFVNVDKSTFKLSAQNARVGRGKTIYPSSHPRYLSDLFFDEGHESCDVSKPLENVDRDSCGEGPWSGSKTFALEQILGQGLVKGEEFEEEVRFKEVDLADKEFFLVTMPLKPQKRKYSSYAAERLAKKKKATAAPPPPSPDVLESIIKIQLHANSTFTSLADVGEKRVLRGRWSIVGEKKEQIRLQTSRFGFGKLSRSTYGNDNDDKCYWGVLSREGTGGEKGAGDGLIKCEGSILVGLGLEPTSIGNFRLLEAEVLDLEG